MTAVSLNKYLNKTKYRNYSSLAQLCMKHHLILILPAPAERLRGGLEPRGYVYRGGGPLHPHPARPAGLPG